MLTTPLLNLAPCLSPSALIGANTSSANFEHSSIAGTAISKLKSLNLTILFNFSYELRTSNANKISFTGAL